MAERQRMTTRFKELFAQQKFFVMAGGMNPMGAKMAEVLGSEVFYMSGGNTSAHQLGWPDSGSSMRDMVDNARKIVLTVNIGKFRRQQKVDNSCVGQTLAFRHTASSVAVLRPACR